MVINKILYSLIWYGSWIVGGITLGLMLHPFIADAYEIVDTSFESGYSLGNLAPQNGWSTTTNPSIQVVNETYGVSAYDGTFQLQTGDVHRYINFPVSTSTYSGEDQQVLSYYWYAYDYTSGTNAPAINTSFRFYSAGNVLQQTLYTCFYPTSNTVATARISSGSNCNSGNIVTVKANMPQGRWVPVVVIYDKSDNTFSMGVDGETPVSYSVALDVDNAYVQPTTIQGYTYGEGFIDFFGWYSYMSQGGGGATYDSSIITSTSLDSDYGVATTTTSFTVNAYVVEADLQGVPEDFKIAGFCTPYPNTLPPPGSQITIPFEGEFTAVTGSQSVTVGFLQSNTIQDITEDRQYRCNAELKRETFWYSHSFDWYTFDFYTFESSSTPEAVAWFNSSLAQSINYNTTGTSTGETRPFEACKAFSDLFDITDCLISPIKFMIVPSSADFDDHRTKFLKLLNSSWPFSVFSEIGTSLYYNTYQYATSTATTSETMPDLSFTMLDNNGATTTITLFTGSAFTSTWDYPVFNTIRNYLEALIYLVWIMWVFFRLRQILPSPEAIGSRV